MPEVKLISPSMEQVRDLLKDFRPELELEFELGTEKLLDAKTIGALCLLPEWSRELSIIYNQEPGRQRVRIERV